MVLPRRRLTLLLVARSLFEALARKRLEIEEDAEEAAVEEAWKEKEAEDARDDEEADGKGDDVSVADSAAVTMEASACSGRTGSGRSDGARRSGAGELESPPISASERSGRTWTVVRP